MKVGPLVTLVQRPDLPLLFGPQNLDRVQRVLTDSIVAQKDPSTLGVLQSLFLRAQPNAARGAARGLGWLCQSGGFQFLILHLNPGDPREALAIEGLSQCLDVRAAKALASRLANSSNVKELDLLAPGAASLGNKAAWSLLSPAQQSVGLDVHDRLSGALTFANHQHPLPSLKAAIKALNP